MEKIVCKNDGWNVVKQFEGWTLGILRYCERFSKCTELERHLLTDEVFVLLAGEVSLLIGREMKEYKLEPGKIFNVKAATWHQLQMSEDAKVLIVENLNTGRANSEYMDI